MSNTILDFPALTKTHNDIFPEGYGDADFGLDKSPLTYYDSQGELQVSSKHVLFRTDTGAELGIHGKNYTKDLRQLSYKTMIDNQREVIRSSGLDTSDITENISLGGVGEKCFVQHILPNEALRTPGGDTASISFLGVSSLNGIWPLSISVGANQWACQNNQIFTSGASMLYKNKHNLQLDIDQGYKLIANSIDVFSKEVDLWHNWSSIPMPNHEAFTMFSRAANCQYVLDYIEQHGESSVNPLALLLENKVYNNTALVYMWEKWVSHYKQRLGANYWGAYNTLTDWSSHGPQSKRGRQTKGNNVVSLNHKRSEIVQGVVRDNFQLAA
jgi:hypothetical protein